MMNLNLGPSRKALALLAGLVGTALLTALATLALISGAAADHQEPSDGDSATIRIAAQRHETGAVSVAVQQQGPGRQWGERLLPALRVVPAGAQPGRWLNSSPVELPPLEVEERPLFCVVAHGQSDDYFWRMLRGFSRRAALDNQLHVRFIQQPNGAAQAAEIDRCSADGAAVIAATLAAPEDVTASLLAAKGAGSRIITFNSGYEDAIKAGSELHIALDDVEAGRLAARQFNLHEMTGTVGCVVHEQNNVGLDARCDAFASVYAGGDVIRIDLPDGADFEEIRAFIAERLTDPDQTTLYGLLTLNGDALSPTMQAIVDTMDELDHEVRTGTVGVARGFIPIIQQVGFAGLRRISMFTINSAPEAQGYLITAALHMAYSNVIPSELIQQPLILNAIPFVYDNSAIRSATPEARAEVGLRLDARLALGEEYLEE